ncbi:uncharacterized protein [Dermacentor albipictus]|uniref:uncharacterized protein isoform X2 n=1 Tax=Dermacentor albipictus TaxID=60249 RepID=UPI0038FBE7BB
MTSRPGLEFRQPPRLRALALSHRVAWCLRSLFAYRKLQMNDENSSDRVSVALPLSNPNRKYKCKHIVAVLLHINAARISTSSRQLTSHRSGARSTKSLLNKRPPGATSTRGNLLQQAVGDTSIRVTLAAAKNDLAEKLLEESRNVRYTGCGSASDSGPQCPRMRNGKRVAEAEWGGAVRVALIQ